MSSTERTSKQTSLPVLRIYLYTAVLAAGAFALSVSLIGTKPPLLGADNPAALVGMCGLLVVAEYLFIRFRYRGEVIALNLLEAVIAPIVFAFTAPVAVATVAAAQIIGGLLRRNPVMKAAFNVAQWSLATAVAGYLLTVMSHHGDDLPTKLTSLALVMIGACLVNQLAFTLVLAIVDRRDLRSVLHDLVYSMLPGWLAGWAVNTLIGLLFVLAYAAHPVAVLFFIVPLAVLHVAYRGYAGARSDRIRLAGLHQAAETLAAPLDPNDAIEAYLREVSGCFEARASALVLRVEGGRMIHRVDVTAETAGYVRLFESDSTWSIEGALMAHPASARTTAASDDALANALLACGWRDCLSAPLVEGGRQVGALLVLDQAGLEGFEAGELAVLEALARETAGTLAKGRLLGTILEERRNLATIVESTSDGILTVGPDGTVRSWNAAMSTITGVAGDDVIGRSARLGVLRLRTASGQPVELDRWATGATLPTDVLIEGTDGATHRLSCSYSEAAERPGSEPALIVVARDVTPSQEMEALREQYGRLAEAERAQREVVEQLQSAVTPQKPTIPDVELSVAYLSSDPTSPTGGDLYDWQRLPSGEVHLAVVDLLGHGVKATKAAVNVIHTLRLLTLQGCAVGDVIREADALLGAQNSELVATVIVARYQPATGVVRIAAGGHPPALRVSPSQGVSQLVSPGCAIGWPEAGTERVTEAILGPGDALVLYTDGLVEARKDILAGMETLVEHAGALAHLGADQLASGLLERALQGAERRDDSLVLVMRRAPVLAQSTGNGTWKGAPNLDTVPLLRRDLRSWLHDQGIAGEPHEELLLVASELLSNAVHAARSAIGMRVWLTKEGRVVLEIEDDGYGQDGLESMGTELTDDFAEAGRGLFIVRTLADDVSILSTSEGSIVRCSKLVPALSARREAARGDASGTATL